MIDSRRRRTNGSGSRIPPSRFELSCGALRARDPTEPEGGPGVTKELARACDHDEHRMNRAAPLGKSVHRSSFQMRGQLHQLAAAVQSKLAQSLV